MHRLDSPNSRITIVSWNIRAGGGRRSGEIARQLTEWNADVVALSEFRGTPPSQRLGAALAERGLTYQHSTVDRKRPRINRLLVASKLPIQRLRLQGAPSSSGRWLMVKVSRPLRFSLGIMHVPNRVSGLKYPFHDSVVALVERWKRGPALLIGDTNTGRIGLDEQVRTFSAREERWMNTLDGLGWKDAFRHLHGVEEVYSWYSPNGRNGFRLDEAFVNPQLIDRVTDVRYEWGRSETGDTRREALSDHAALIVEIAL